MLSRRWGIQFKPFLPNSSVCSISTPEEKKAFVRAIAFGGCAKWKCFFFQTPPHLTQEVFACFLLLFALSLYSSLFLVLPLIWTLTSKSAPGCLSQTAVQRCDNAFFLPVPFMTFFSSSFCSFFLFFPFQGLAHLTLNDQGMGSFLFVLVLVFFFFWEELTQPLRPQPPLYSRFPSQSPPLLLTFPQCHIPPFLPKVSLAFSSLCKIPPWLPYPSSSPSMLIFFGLSLLLLLALPAAISLCISVTSTNVCPTPCPVLWLTSWTFTSDHLWPRRPDPGLKVTLFCYPFCLGWNKDKKTTAENIGNVFVGQVKKKRKYVSRLPFTNTSRWKCCRMCRVSHHPSADIPIVWHSVFLKACEFWYNFKICVRLPWYGKIWLTAIVWMLLCYIWCCAFTTHMHITLQLFNLTTHSSFYLTDLWPFVPFASFSLVF